MCREIYFVQYPIMAFHVECYTFLLLIQLFKAFLIVAVNLLQGTMFTAKK